MKTCVRCGKEIDVISKDPDKVFYCKKCSFEVLNINEEELFKKENKIGKKEYYLSFYLLPGTFQLKEGKLLSSFIYLFTFYLLPFAWFIFSLLIYTLEEKNQLLKDGTNYYSVFILIQMLLIYAKNIMEVRNEVNRDKGDI